MSTLLIWWTDQPESEAADTAWLDQESGEPRDDVDVPDYLTDELHCRVGRAGRGRLWVPLCLSEEWAKHSGATMTAFDAGGVAAADMLTRSCGGIVFRAEDLHHVRDMPGRITDLALIPQRIKEGVTR